MGLSVTAAHIILFIAMLTAGSAAMDAFWDTTRVQNDARHRWERLALSQLDTNLTLSVNECNSGCDPKNPPDVRVRLDVRNSGTVVVDYRNLTYLIDGIAHTVANVTDYDIVSPTAISNTDLIMPGETMRIEFRDVVLTADYANDGSNLPVQVITLDGVIGRR